MIVNLYYFNMFFFLIFLGLSGFSSFKKSFDLNNKNEIKGKKINFNEDEEINITNDNNNINNNNDNISINNDININRFNNNNLLSNNQRMHSSLLSTFEKGNLLLRNKNNSNELKNCIKQNNIINTKICCTCTKTNCIKKYCACYSNGKFCDGCECINCMNTSKNKKEKENENRNRNILNYENNVICNCTKSNCLKKYCECYKLGKECGTLCRCIGCANKTNKNSNGDLIHLLNNEKNKVDFNKFYPYIFCNVSPFITECIGISITNGIMKISKRPSENKDDDIHKTPKLSNRKRMRGNKNDSTNLKTCSSTIVNSVKNNGKVNVNKNVKTKKLLLN